MSTNRHNLNDPEKWTMVIEPGGSLFKLGIKEIWRYRDLVMLFVKRDFVSFYKQTILGPLWYIIQPVLTIIVFSIVFGKIAGISTDNMPPALFYMSGLVLWNYFADCLNKTSGTFINNAHIFGKVYFPRLAVPISVIISNLISFCIQTLLLLAMMAYYASDGYPMHFGIEILWLPLILCTMAMLGLGVGIIIASLTTKYRDLRFTISFGVQLLMYATPVIYPVSSVPAKFKFLLMMNPVSPLIEGFRASLLGSGAISISHLAYSFMTTLIILMTGLVLFNRIEKNFTDTI
jgi:lipopolysaccharide transport system permease protein